MSRAAVFVLSAVSASLALGDALPCQRKRGEDVANPVTYEGEDLPREEIVARFPGLRDVLTAWAPFADEHGYRLVLADEGRVLLIVSDNHSRLKSGRERHEVTQFVELAAATNTVCNTFLTAPKAAPPPLVLVCTRHADYEALVTRLGELHPRLEKWTNAAGKTAAGFVLSEPLIGAWIDDPPGVTEWRPFNELVHRLAQLRIRREAPFLPDWLLLGLAWHVEDGVRRSVYCFPHRAGFVSATSHTDWGLWLANSFKKRTRKKQKKPEILELLEFADWHPRNDAGFQTGKAYLSFGVARYLAMEHPKELQTLAHKLSDATAKGRKVILPDKTWRLDPDYVLPVASQAPLLAEVEADYLAKATRWFQKKKAKYYAGKRK